MDLSSKLLGNDISLVMKAEGLFCFWMVEHDYYLGGKS